MKKKLLKKKIGGFGYFRTKEQILDYMSVPAVRKLEWLEEWRRFNALVARSQPQIAEIQEKFRRGDI